MIPIDSIVCISLPHRHDRREALIKDIDKAFDLEVLPRLDVEFAHRYPPGCTRIPEWWTRNPGYYLATREHAAVLEDLWLRGSQYALILEDDAEFFPDFYTEMKPFWDEVHKPYTQDGKPWKWWCLLIGANINRAKHSRLTDNIAINKGAWGCQSYIVNREGMAALYDEVIKNPLLVVDETYVEMAGRRSRFLSPRGGYLTGQRAGFSDSAKKIWKGDKRRPLEMGVA